MFLDLKKIGVEGLAFEQGLKLPELEGTGGEKIVVLEARLDGEVEKGKHGFELAGHLDAVLTVECSRCLVPFTLALARNFFLTLVPEASEAETRNEYDEEEEATLFSCPDGRADLIQMASEQIYLNLPLKPVCREGCRGLCPVCGANRNLADCDCRSEAVDPRLAPLIQFKSRRRI